MNSYDNLLSLAVDCPEGMYSDGEKKKPKCLECAVGTYNPTSKQTKCLDCESPKSTLLSASSSADDCKSKCFFIFFT